MYQKHHEVLEVVNGSSAQGGEGESTENELAFDGTTDLALTSQQAVLQHDDTRPCFSHHFHAFQARKQHPLEYFICKQSHLYDHTVLAAYVISSQPCLYHIPLKYQLVEND